MASASTPRSSENSKEEDKGVPVHTKILTVGLDDEESPFRRRFTDSPPSLPDAAELFAVIANQFMCSSTWSGVVQNIEDAASLGELSTTVVVRTSRYEMVTAVLSNKGYFVDEPVVDPDGVALTISWDPTKKARQMTLNSSRNRRSKRPHRNDPKNYSFFGHTRQNG